MGSWLTLIRRRRRGAILVLVLVLLALSAALAAQISANAVRHAARAALAEKSLQQRWAVVSLRRGCLEFGPRLLVDSAGRPVARRDLTVTLAGTTYYATLADENAKFPLHRAARRFSQAEALGAARRLAGSGVSFRANWPADPEGWADLLRPRREPSRGDAMNEVLVASQRLTLWSDGRLNLWTSDGDTLDELWRLRFGSAASDRLHAAAEMAEGRSLADVLIHCELSESEFAFASEWLTGESHAFSVWLREAPTAGRVAGGTGFRGVYVRRHEAGYADEEFGFHEP